jgi:hypothetical protein
MGWQRTLSFNHGSRFILALTWGLNITLRWRNFMPHRWHKGTLSIAVFQRKNVPCFQHSSLFTSVHIFLDGAGIMCMWWSAIEFDIGLQLETFLNHTRIVHGRLIFLELAYSIRTKQCYRGHHYVLWNLLMSRAFYVGAFWPQRWSDVTVACGCGRTLRVVVLSL